MLAWLMVALPGFHAASSEERRASERRTWPCSDHFKSRPMRREERIEVDGRGDEPGKKTSRGLGRVSRPDPAGDKEEPRMPAEIHRGDVQRLMAGGAQVVDVLPPEEY
ncbi:MAG: hypothetical protein C4345_00600, partial [Chloroflexota bacterium]